MKKRKPGKMRKLLSLLLAVAMLLGMGIMPVSAAEEKPSEVVKKEAAEKTGAAAEAAAVDSQAVSAVADGVYRVTVDLYQLYDSTATSMGNAALRGSSSYNQAHATDDPSYQALLLVENGEGTLIMEYMAMGYVGSCGYLLQLDGLTDIVYGNGDLPSSYSLSPAEVLAEHRMTDGTAALDSFNDPDSEWVMENANGKAYPHIVALPVTLPETEEQMDSASQFVHVFVPVMESITAGNGDQLARLKLDYANMTQVTDLSGEVEYWLYQAMHAEKGRASDEAWQALQDLITETKAKLSNTLVSLTMSGQVPVRTVQEMDGAARAEQAAKLKEAIAALEPSIDEDGWDGVSMTEPVWDGTTVYIKTAAELAWVSDAVQERTAAFDTVILQADIDMNYQSVPSIGMNLSPFTGIFDGAGHTIYNMYMTNSGSYRGLFGYVKGTQDQHAAIQNVTLKGSYAPGDGQYLGALAGRAEYTDIKNCVSEIDVLCTPNDGTSAYVYAYVGGIVGGAFNSTITGCKNTGDVSAVGKNWVAGIAAYCSSTDVKNCTNEGNITGQNYVAGIASYAMNSVSEYGMENLCNLGDINGSSNVGGILGWAQNVKLRAAYNRGNVAGNGGGNVGGLASALVGTGGIYGAYNTGTVGLQDGASATGNYKPGAIVGNYLSGTLENVCAEEGSCEKLTHQGSESGTIGFLSSAWMKSAVFFTTMGDYAEYFTEDTENVNDGYPILKTQVEPEADYTAVDAAIEKAGELIAENYKNFDAVNTAVAEVVRGMKAGAQSKVDAMALAIETAIAALEYKDADYTAVDAALAKVPGDLTVYTMASAQALESAVAAVERGKNITGQAEVDAMASAIEEALSGLTEFEMPFSDVAEDSWYYEYVRFVYENGIMTGMGEGDVFAPEELLLRAQFAMILYRMEGTPEVEPDGKFPDIPEDEWYTEAVTWASQAGIVTGYAHNGYFGPADHITREQLAVMMFRYAQMKDYDTSARADLSSYEDADSVNTYAQDAMAWAVAEKLISGKYDQTRLDPLGNATRAECAAIITRFLGE